MNLQDIITNLQKYWQNQGCLLLQPYDMEVGAGTFHPSIILWSLLKQKWNVTYVQPSRRPQDGRYGDNPNRLQHYYQLQTFLQPAPNNVQRLFINSLNSIGINNTEHDIRFVEDNWESKTLGASGLGWEVWCDGMEIAQFTYFQKLCNMECITIAVELTYGLERIAMFQQNIDSVYKINFNDTITYGEVFKNNEQEYSTYNFEYADIDMLIRHFQDYIDAGQNLIEKNLPLPAYDYCIKASHTFNILDARAAISAKERVNYVNAIQILARECCSHVIDKYKLKYEEK